MSTYGLGPSFFAAAPGFGVKRKVSIITAYCVSLPSKQPHRAAEVVELLADLVVGVGAEDHFLIGAGRGQFKFRYQESGTAVVVEGGSGGGFDGQADPLRGAVERRGYLPA
jgi:hypothetical protein